MKNHGEISTYLHLKHCCGKKSDIFPYSVYKQKPRDYPSCKQDPHQKQYASLPSLQPKKKDFSDK